MLLEELIQNFWRNSETLCAIVPAERFLTGTASNFKTPCVFLVVENEETLFHTNRTGAWKKHSLVFTMYFDAFESGTFAAKKIEEIFDRCTLSDPTSESTLLYSFQYLKGENTQRGETGWKFVRKFRVFG